MKYLMKLLSVRFRLQHALYRGCFLRSKFALGSAHSAFCPDGFADYYSNLANRPGLFVAAPGDHNPLAEHYLLEQLSIMYNQAYC
jgi:hypothetical protein